MFAKDALMCGGIDAATSAGAIAATSASQKNLVLPQDKFAQNALPSVCRKTCTCS
jgi:hypothetical protein